MVPTTSLADDKATSTGEMTLADQYDRINADRGVPRWGEGRPEFSHCRQKVGTCKTIPECWIYEEPDTRGHYLIPVVTAT